MSYPAPTSGSRSRLISGNFKKIFSGPGISHPHKNFTAQLYNAEHQSNTASHNDIKISANHGLPNTSSVPGHQFEPGQMATGECYDPDSAKSIKLSSARQALIEDIIALYSCQPTVQRVKRYSPDCIYDDQFVYANDRYQMAGRWFALPELFSASLNESYEVIRSDDDLIQFKNKQSWTFRDVPKTIAITSLVSLSLDPETRDSNFMQIKCHRDRTIEKDHSHEGPGFSFKKWLADHVIEHMSALELKEFEADKGAAKKHMRKCGTGREERSALRRDLTS